jgi:hypothetical protein
MSTLHQLAIGLNIPEKTLYSWNKNFKIVLLQNENGELGYTEDQKAFVLRIHHLIKERGFTIAGAKLELEKKPLEIDSIRDETIAKLNKVRQFLIELKDDLKIS